MDTPAPHGTLLVISYQSNNIQIQCRYYKYRNNLMLDITEKNVKFRIAQADSDAKRSYKL